MGRPHQAVIIGLAVLALGGTIVAQTAPPPPPPPVIPPPGSTITLAQAIDVALSNNPDTRVAWLQARAAEADIGSARAAYYPEIDVLANATRSRPAVKGAAATTTIAPSVALTYLLFDFGGREAVVEQARQAPIAANLTNRPAG